MIERDIIKQKKKEYMIEKFIGDNLKRVGHSHTKLVKTPLGEKVIIHASRPGLIVGRKGQNIKTFTKVLEKEFNLENPQIEIIEVENIYLDPQIVAENIASSLEQFGTSGFKGVGHKAMADIMKSGALGVEILITGKIPGSRAKRWRFYQGYLKKCGDTAIEGVKTAYVTAQLKTGTVGVQVRIMPPDLRLPDNVKIEGQEEEDKPIAKEETKEPKDKKKDDSAKADEEDNVKESPEESKPGFEESDEEESEDTKKSTKKKATKKKTAKKKATKKKATKKKAAKKKDSE